METRHHQLTFQGPPPHHNPLGTTVFRSLDRPPAPLATSLAPSVPPLSEPESPDPDDRRSSLQIAACGFCFLAVACTSLGGFWTWRQETRLLGIVFLVVGAAAILATTLFVPASRKGKLPAHRRALPLLLALVLWAVSAWIVFLVVQTSVDGKGILAALAAFLLLFSIVLLRVVCHRRRDPKARRRRDSDSDVIQLEDFHHVNTQVRDTLRTRFAAGDSSPASDVPFVPEGRTMVPTAPPETPPSPEQPPPMSFSTFVREAPSAPSALLDNPPPYDGGEPPVDGCRTPPPPYSTLV
ncbi:uncharacterized protein LOC135398710 [Ornithodoros turicata]|uniref:uncharacterized protein LOC135398710 n=1 Tax=Ornithodoros turicata TaxID=34597 RepID=UPI003138F23B